jgi:DNA polymerase V
MRLKFSSTATIRTIIRFIFRMTKTKTNKKPVLEVYKVDNSSIADSPLFTSGVSAGFPSPADDYIELKLDLNKYLIKHPSATFYVKVKGDSMKNAGINDEDILIVDRALEPRNNDIVVCVIDSEFTVKKIKKTKDSLYLLPENPEYKPIKVTESNSFQVWGVVSYVIHKTLKQNS